jgi:hypothetical protein
MPVREAITASLTGTIGYTGGVLFRIHLLDEAEQLALAHFLQVKRVRHIVFAGSRGGYGYIPHFGVEFVVFGADSQEGTLLTHGECILITQEPFFTGRRLENGVV